MANSNDLSPIVIELLQERGKDMPAVDLVNQLVRDGNDLDQVLRVLRSMLNSGQIGLGPEMDIRPLKQFA